MTPSRLLLGITILLALCAAGCRRSAESYLKKGNALVSAHKYAEATLNYRTAIQKDPHLGEAYYQLALAEFQLKNAAAGYQLLERAAELLPARADVKLAFAEVSLTAYLQNKQRPKAMHDKVSGLADELIASNTKAPEGFRLKGYLALADQKLPDAERFFRKANDLKPMEPATILGLAEALYLDKQPEQAEALGLKLIEQNKSYGPMYELLYSKYAAAGRVADAENILAKKARSNPADATSILQLAAFYAVHSKPDMMKAELQQLLNAPKTFPQAHLQVGDFYARMQRWPEALQQYDEGARSNPSEKIAYLKRTAETWLAQGKGEQAGQVVDQILKQDPSDDSAKAVKASLLLASGKPENVAQSVTQFRQLVASNPDNAVWQFNLGRALLADGDMAGARHSFEEAVKKRSDFLPPRLALADLSMATGDFNSALLDADQIIATTPNSGAAHRLRAVSLINLGRYADAREELAKLDKALPDEVQLQLATIEIKEKNFHAAEDRLRKLSETRPGNDRVISTLVLAFLSENSLDKAESFLDEQVKKTPGSDVARRLQAEVEMRSGKYALAIDHYKQFLSRNPNSAQLYLALGNAYRLSGDRQNAVSNFQKAAAIAPKDATPQAFLAEIQSDTGDKAAAVQSFKKALELSPDNVLLMNNLAYLMGDSGGNLDEALALVQKALQKAPGQPNLIDTLGWIYLKKSWNDSALQVFRGLTDKYPNNPTFRYHFGMALLQKGDKVTAKSEFRSGLASKPSGEVRQNIETALAKIQ